MTRKSHWEKVYDERAPDEVSWHQKEPAQSLRLIKAAAPVQDAAVLDVGGGASVLIDRLLAEGYSRLAVLDVSGKALALAQARLGPAAARVRWLEADVTQAELPAGACDVWHDRAVFHFLTNPKDRRAYLSLMSRALGKNGQAVIATFSPAGPPKCSGLEVMRYSSETLARELGEGFRLVESAVESHETPFGTRQEFVYCRFARAPGLTARPA